MKTKILIGVLLLCLFLPTGGLLAESGSGEPVITFFTTQQSFGKIKENGKKIYIEYPFENTGTAPIVFIRAETSCSCVKVELPKRPVPPGEEGVVRLLLNPKNQAGVMNKAIRIFTNTEPKLSVLILTGEIVADR